MSLYPLYGSFIYHYQHPTQPEVPNPSAGPKAPATPPPWRQVVEQYQEWQATQPVATEVKVEQLKDEIDPLLQAVLIQQAVPMGARK